MQYAAYPSAFARLGVARSSIQPREREPSASRSAFVAQMATCLHVRNAGLGDQSALRPRPQVLRPQEQRSARERESASGGPSPTFGSVSRARNGVRVELRRSPILGSSHPGLCAQVGAAAAMLHVSRSLYPLGYEPEVVRALGRHYWSVACLSCGSRRLRWVAFSCAPLAPVIPTMSRITLPFVRVRANSSLPRFTAPAAASVPSPAAKRETPESPTCSVVTSGKPSVSDIAMPPPDGSSVTECRESDTLFYATGGVP